ncbi:shikimate dehydrogenase [Orbaceae bacterium ac157xtp]
MSHFTPYSIYGIIGYPLNHSLSPLLHTTAFKDLDIPAVLVPFATPPDELANLIKSVRLLNIRGLCVTIPHKQTVMPYLDHISDRAKKVGAVNLIYWQGDKLCGDNTDVKGFMQPLIKNPLPKTIQKVLLLGAGGAARAVVVGLQELEYSDITVTGVNPQSPENLAKEFNLKTVEWQNRGSIGAQFIINTTPLGMTGKFENETPYDKAWFKGEGAVYDIVYTPNITKFGNEAKQAGWRSISGIDMFIGQANEQFTIWTGQPLSTNAINQVIDALKS